MDSLEATDWPRTSTTHKTLENMLMMKNSCSIWLNQCL